MRKSGHLCGALALCFLLLGTFPGRAARSYDFVVAQDGSGHFRSIQEAVNAAPDYCAHSTTIFIKAGTYKEKITVPPNKRKLHLIGEDAATTRITYNDYALKIGPTGHPLGTSATSTLFIYADDFLAQDLCFENASGEGPDIAQACAVTVDAHRVAFLRCRFIGNQDTLYTYGKGQQQYYKDCWIEGTTDFIFGASTAYFDRCTILSKKNSYVTAASTPQGAPYGYVFRQCRFIHSPQTTQVYLGRPWRPYAKTVLIDCYLDDHIRPQGWHDWDKAYAHKISFYAEYGSSGPGAAPQSARVKWSHRLRPRQAALYVPQVVLDTPSELDKHGVAVKIPWHFQVF